MSSSPPFAPPPGENSPARDVQTLRRLTRDAFGEITALRDRLLDLEKSAAVERANRRADRVRKPQTIDHALS
jgi:hypothetical protein